jgi:F-type H+-transporting ATPase subunit epsilon
MSTIKLEIVTPHGVIYDGDVKVVTLCGKDGEFGVLPGHAALVSLLDAGLISATTPENKEVVVAINGGYAKVSEEKVSCIVDGAVAVNDQEGNLSENIAKAKELLKSAQSSDTAIASAVSKIESIKK